MIPTGNRCLQISVTVLIVLAGHARADGPAVLPQNPHALDPGRACGVYCVKFLDSYFGRTTPYAKTAALCGPGPQGTSLKDLRDALESLGMYAAGVKVTVRKLHEIGLPAILSVRSENEGEDEHGHFVVWLEYDSRQDAVRVFSPPGWLGWKAVAGLEQSYAGRALIVSSTPLPEDLKVEQPVPPGVLWVWACVLLLSVLGIVLVSRGSQHRSLHAFHWLLLPGSLLLFAQGCSEEEENESRVRDVGRSDIVKEQASAGGASGSPWSIDLGRVGEGTKLQHTFRITNTTEVPVRIINVEKSCQCQAVDLRVGTVIAPGDELRVPVTISTRGQRGRIVRQLRLHTDSRDERFHTVSLQLSAEVESTLRAIPSHLVFGNLHSGEGITRTLRVESFRHGLIESFQEVRSSHSSVGVRLRNRKPGVLVFDVSVGEESPVGELRGAVTLTFGDRANSAVSVPFAGIRMGALQVLPRELLVGSLAAHRSRTRIIRVKSTAEQPFQITGLDCPDWIAADQSVFGKQSDVEFDVELEVKGSRRPGRLSTREDAEIIIHTAPLGDVRCPVRLISGVSR